MTWEWDKYVAERRGKMSLNFSREAFESMFNTIIGDLQEQANAENAAIDLEVDADATANQLNTGRKYHHLCTVVARGLIAKGATSLIITKDLRFNDIPVTNDEVRKDIGSLITILMKESACRCY